jgi:hypothetical protein
LLLDEFEKIYLNSSEACSNEFDRNLLFQHSLSNILCLGRHTITGLLCTSGKQFKDWSSDYRFYSKERFNSDIIFDQIRSSICSKLEKSKPLVVAMDDSIIKKVGTKIHGVAYRRDPMGPPFQVNFIRGQRVLQISAAVPSDSGSARMIPISFSHAPSVKKPNSKASPELQEQYKEEKKQKNLSKQGLKQIKNLRCDMVQERDLWLTVDGSYTNSNVLKGLPEKTTLIGRIRSDAKLYYPPNDFKKCGRMKFYGKRAPTPEELRQNKEIPYQIVPAYAAGKMHDFKVKTIELVKWKSAGGKHNLKVVVIAPLAYRLTLNGKTLYRNPAYLICTNPLLSIEEILQAYLWRWDIELNNRDEKTIFGLGQAQVRNEKSVEQTMKLSVASYSSLLLAGINAFGTNNTEQLLPPTKWMAKKKKERASTQDYLSKLRHEVWSRSLNNSSLGGFDNGHEPSTKPMKFKPPIFNALFYGARA